MSEADTDDETTIEIPVPEDDRKDYAGMLEDCIETLPDDVAIETIRQQLSASLGTLIEEMYDNRERLAREIEQAQGGQQDLVADVDADVEPEADAE